MYQSKKYDFTIYDRAGAGDANIVTKNEVMELANGNTSGSVQR